MFNSMRKAPDRLKKTYADFSPRFWALVGASFIDHVGQKMIFPFFSLYITDRFDVGMTQAGILLSLFTVSGMTGSLLGGALADRFGRKLMVLFGLVVSALSALAMGFVDRLVVFYVLAVVVGLLSDIAGPAWQAMVADLVPEEKRTEGFGVMRVVDNLAWIIGPIIGGFLAGYSYLLLFIIDAVASVITAGLIFRLIPETRPAATDSAQEPESTIQTFAGYGRVFRNRPFISYLLAVMLMTVVYLQMYGALSVYLRDVHGVSPQGFSFVLTTSAVLVVLFQFPVSSWSKRYPPLLVMAAGAGLYMIGFGAYGLISAYPLFLAAMAVITFGEMLVVPVGQALAARFAPEDMRGRYMAVFGLSWAVPGIIGPPAAGVLLDYFNPNLVWYIGAALCFVAVLAFTFLHQQGGERFAPLEASEPSSLAAD